MKGVILVLSFDPPNHKEEPLATEENIGDPLRGNIMKGIIIDNTILLTVIC